MKKKLAALLLSAVCAVAAVPVTAVYADGQKVVTLGADLTEDQKNAILRYFGVYGQNIETLTITNQDERDHLSSYIPIEQIGTRTFSCALVSPTTSGGIQVKTANLSYVTSNMIASQLSTSGVVNCDVLAASPFEVSGTGALTGILMAYESASGEKLDETKKEIATQEMVTTTTIAETVGQQQATQIVNDTKMQVIQGSNVTQNDIDIIVNEVAEEKQISLTDEDRELLKQLLEEIAAQDYDYDDVKETLERVEVNVDVDVNNSIDTDQVIDTDTTVDQSQNAEASSDSSSDASSSSETLSSDSILMNTDESALGDSAFFDATDEAALDETEAASTDESTVSGEFDITTSDEYTDGSSDDSSSESTGEAVTETEAAAEGQEDQTAEAAGEDTEDSVIPISDFVFDPVTSDATSYEVYDAGTNMLTVSFEDPSITAGSGTISVYNAADSSLVETIQMNNTDQVAIEDLDSDSLQDLGWTSGKRAVIYLNSPLAQNSQYYVALSEGAFISEDGSKVSAPTEDAYAWTLNTSAYGFALNLDAHGVEAGDTVSGEILMDNTDAGYAVISSDDSSISFDQTDFLGSSSLNVTFFESGDKTLKVEFYDQDGGNLLYTASYLVDVK